MKKTKISDEEKTFLQMIANAEDIPDEPKIEEIGAELADAVDKLAAIDELIKEELENANLGKRDDMEELYCVKTDLLYYLARGFYPFSEYGRDTLAEAKKTRLEYEQLVAPLASRITKNNLNIFAPLLTEDLMEEILIGKTDAIGAIRGGKGAYGAGVIAYYIDEDPLSSDSVIVRIKWLYVAEAFRQKGIANFLIGTLLSQISGINVSAVTADIPAVNDFAEVVTFIFDRWGFTFTTGTTPEFVADIDEIDGIEEMEALVKGARPLASSGGDPAVIIKKYMQRSAHPGYIKTAALPKGYIDPELSFYTGEWNRAGAMLLTHITPSGVLSVELLDAADDDEEQIKCLISAFLMKALGSYGGGTKVSVPVESEIIGEFMDSICPDSQGGYLIEGVLPA